MAFDGVDYDAAPFIWPNHASPGAPVDGVGVASALEAAYFVGRRQNQLLVSIATAWNGQRPGEALGSAFAVFSSDFVEWSNNPVFIPEGATHLKAHVVFAAQPIVDSTAHFRLGTYASADTSFSTKLHGTEVTQAVHAGGSDLLEGVRSVEGLTKGTDFSVNNLAAENLVYEAEFEMALSSPSPGYNTRVFVEGYILEALAVSYRPLYITIWWEVREATT